MSLITINTVNCKDCYKCVRLCPMKAIRVVNGHAEVDAARCVADGSCLRVCPQHAKHPRSDRDVVRAVLAGGRPVMASIAPSAAGTFGDRLPQFISALKALGFARVEETARTAEAVSRATTACMRDDRPVIASACPAVVAMVERYYPHLTPCLAAVPSPMVAHARLLREEHGDAAIVFIGPCVAKKGEEDLSGVDAALTFDEVLAWLRDERIVLDTLAPGSFDNPPVGTAELFPMLSGLVTTAGLEATSMSEAVITVDGLSEVRAVLDELDRLPGVRLIEALACKGGCLQGPGAFEGPAPWVRRQQLVTHAGTAGVGAAPADMRRVFCDMPLTICVPAEEEIVAVLRRTGKHVPADEQNCGACGYDTCREKAVAVLQGMAEAEMCIPYMRSRAESFANVVIRATPNGIVVVDSALRILDANPAFLNLFASSLNEMIGRPVKPFLDPSGFERVKRTGKPFSRQEVVTGDKILRETIVPVADEEIIIGLYVDVTEETTREQKQQAVKRETLQKARQVIDKQMRVAQEIAGLLGETTAETKVLLTRLIHLTDEETKGE